MARSINEIKKTMTDAFMANADIREKYGLSATDTFEGSFSTVSLENILFYIIAACCHVLETFFDTHKAEVDEKVAHSIVASIPWYHKMALQFQYGDELVFDETVGKFLYPITDESRQPVKYAAVRDMGTYLRILVAGEKDGIPEQLPTGILTVFEHYMNRIKVAGIILDIASLPADRLMITATVTVDPLVMTDDGTDRTGGNKPVEEAVRNYLKNIRYGGTFNKTKLVDAIQAADGVLDVELHACACYDAETQGWNQIEGNSYTGPSGCYEMWYLENGLAYVLQN